MISFRGGIKSQQANCGSHSPGHDKEAMVWTESCPTKTLWLGDKELPLLLRDWIAHVEGEVGCLLQGHSNGVEVAHRIFQGVVIPNIGVRLWGEISAGLAWMNAEVRT